MINRCLAVLCPAKVNLLLRVRGRRPDGYHEIGTIFQAIDLFDRIEAQPSSSLTLTCDASDLPTDARNLVLRAARLLQDRFPGQSRGASLHLAKRIPVGGGLGGGSSNGAGALRLLCDLWGIDPGPEALPALAAELGSDVPFFLMGGTALGTGRGERLTPLPPWSDRLLLLGLPPFGISTAEVYRRHGKRLTGPGRNVSLQRLSTFKLPEGKDFAIGENDLESVVFEGWPELRDFRDALAAEGARAARVSGSGSTVFGWFEDASRREAAIGNLARRFGGWRLLAAKTIDESVRIVPAGSGR